MKKFVWKHVGGGCLVGKAARGVKFPCDDRYEHLRTGLEATVYTTRAKHRKMPRKVECMCSFNHQAGVSTGGRE